MDIVEVVKIYILSFFVFASLVHFGGRCCKMYQEKKVVVFSFTEELCLNMAHTYHVPESTGKKSVVVAEQEI